MTVLPFRSAPYTPPPIPLDLELEPDDPREGSGGIIWGARCLVIAMALATVVIVAWWLG